MSPILSTGSFFNTSITPVSGDVSGSTVSRAIQLYLSSTFTTTGSYTAEKLPFNTLQDGFSDSGMYDSTNVRVNPYIPGFYVVIANCRYNTAINSLLQLYKNGSRVKNLDAGEGNSATERIGMGLVYCNGTTDYLEMYIVTQLSVTVESDSRTTSFSVYGPIDL